MALPAFSQLRTFERARSLALSSLIGLGRRTVTGLITTCGQQFCDWTATYRLFNEARINQDRLFQGVIKASLRELDPQAPFVVSMDDTLLKKKGLHVDGTSWRRDPHGPKFADNFFWAQRFLQLSVSLPEVQGQPSRARAIPIGFHHCPSPRKPGKRGTDEQWKEYWKLREQTKISTRGTEKIWALRGNLDALPGGKERELIVTVDGSYANDAVLRHLPPRTTLIGRIRRDAKLNALPDPEPAVRRGRARVYGADLPTPEELRQGDELEWREVKAWAAGRIRSFSVKTLDRVRWRKAGGKQDLRLVIIKPLAYARDVTGNLLYRKPAYLICTNPDLPLEEIIQYYVWRWEIEVNFRDEKSLLGVGQAQVRTKKSVEAVPSFIVAAYAFFLLAVHKTFGRQAPLPRPRWRKRSSAARIPTLQALNMLRADLWGKALGLRNKTDFVQRPAAIQRADQFRNALPSAVLYATG